MIYLKGMNFRCIFFLLKEARLKRLSMIPLVYHSGNATENGSEVVMAE